MRLGGESRGISGLEGLFVSGRQTRRPFAIDGRDAVSILWAAALRHLFKARCNKNQTGIEAERAPSLQITRAGPTARARGGGARRDLSQSCETTSETIVRPRRCHRSANPAVRASAGGIGKLIVRRPQGGRRVDPLRQGRGADGSGDRAAARRCWGDRLSEAGEV